MYTPVFFFSVLAACLLGCPATKSAAPATCTKFGETCQFAEGKLGTCVLREGCDPKAGGRSCYVCQSQH